MTLFRTFLAHEAATQLRSTRFRAMSLVYILAASAPVVILYPLSRHAAYDIGSATYALLLDSFQPLLTMLFAGLLAVDAITREREEGSFAVVSLAPISAAGYLLRRWLAVMSMALLVTLVPRLIGIALAAAQHRRMPMLSAFALGWLLHVLPVLVIVSALALALGTINGNIVVAIIVGAMLLTAGLGLLNDIFAHWHHSFGDPFELIFFDTRLITELQWSLRGMWQPELPTEAGYPLALVLDLELSRAALFFGTAALLLGISTIYLRRTRRDLKPWRPRADHPLRSTIRLAGRLRETYWPDGSLGLAEWSSIAAGVLLFAASIAFLIERTRVFERLGAERYAAYMHANPLPMTTDVLPLAARVRGSLARDGRLNARAELTLRNGGTRPVTHLGFALNPLVAVREIRSSRGRARIDRLWQRIGLDVDPPLAPGESRTLAFELDGAPGDVSIPIPWSGGWRAKWSRYLAATTTGELTDLSRSTIIRAVDETRLALDASDVMPVPRYSTWRVDDNTDTFVIESVQPAAAIDVVLAQPFDVVADSCGRFATRGAALESRCSMPLASYQIAGGPLATIEPAPGITLAYIHAHDALARVQGPALAAAVGRVEQAWTGLMLARPIVYVEMPAGRERRPRDYYEWMAQRELGGSGALHVIPESSFRRYRSLDEGETARSLIVGALRTRRPVVAKESFFFRELYAATASRRVGGHSRSSAVVPALNAPPRSSLFGYGGRPRIGYVTQALEARAGGHHVVEGINDFVAAGPRPGTARELFAAIGRRAGIDLTRMYDDYVAGDKVPRLTFESVTFRRTGPSWEVRGMLHNENTGEAFCPIALRTANGSQWQTLRVDSGERVPFVFTTIAEPHTLQLDPERVCYREAFVGAIESVDYRGES